MFCTDQLRIRKIVESLLETEIIGVTFVQDEF